MVLSNRNLQTSRGLVSGGYVLLVSGRVSPASFKAMGFLGRGWNHLPSYRPNEVMMHEFIVGPLPFGRDTDDQLQLLKEIMEVGSRLVGPVTICKKP